jgi:hypothetical protein
MSFESNSDGRSRWSRPRWYELLPEVLLAAGLMFFLIDDPDAATSALKSNRAVGLMAAAAVLWIAGRVVLARFLHARLARTAPFGLAGLGVLVVVVVPAYLKTVVEAFRAHLGAGRCRDERPHAVIAADYGVNSASVNSAGHDSRCARR